MFDNILHDISKPISFSTSQGTWSVH